MGEETIPVPMVVGHEFVGEIVEVGSNVKDFFPGQVVSGEGHVVAAIVETALQDGAIFARTRWASESIARAHSPNTSRCP